MVTSPCATEFPQANSELQPEKPETLGHKLFWTLRNFVCHLEHDLAELADCDLGIPDCSGNSRTFCLDITINKRQQANFKSRGS